MKKDITKKRLEDHNDVYADIFNALLFDGEKILEEEYLVPLPTESFTRNMDGSLRQGNRDIRKADRRNGLSRRHRGEAQAVCCKLSDEFNSGDTLTRVCKKSPNIRFSSDRGICRL